MSNATAAPPPTTAPRIYRRRDLEFDVKNPVSVFWHCGLRQPCHTLAEDKEDTYAEMKIWRKLAKQGRLEINPKNHTDDREYKGVKYYGFCVQVYDEAGNLTNNHDPLAALLFDFQVNGMCYFFPSKRNRDRIAAWVMKGIALRF